MSYSANLFHLTIRRTNDKMRKLRQHSLVSKNSAKFRNTILTISDINNFDRLERFVDGLKYAIRVEILNRVVSSFEKATRVDLYAEIAT